MNRSKKGNYIRKYMDIPTEFAEMRTDDLLAYTEQLAMTIQALVTSSTTSLNASVKVWRYESRPFRLGKIEILNVPDNLIISEIEQELYSEKPHIFQIYDDDWDVDDIDAIKRKKDNPF